MWGSVFAVPTDIIDKYLKFAGLANLKVLLWLLRNNAQKRNISAQDIATALNMNMVDVKDAMEFWYEMGVVKKTMSNPEKTVSSALSPETSAISPQIPMGNPSVVPIQAVPSTVKETVHTTTTEEVTPNTQTKSAVRTMPTTAEIADRKKLDNNFSDLLDEAEKMLARPITHSDSSILLLMHDYDGLPYEVIKMILFLANEQKKLKMRYIETLGREWGAEEIYTIEKAEEKIANILNSYKEWKRIAPIFGLNAGNEVNDIQAEYAECWVRQWGYDDNMLRIAYETCINAKGTFHLKYINGILKKWHSEGILSEKDLSDRRKSNDESVRKERKKPKNTTDSGGSSASYDIDFLNDSIGLLD